MRASHACATLALTAVVCSEPLHAQGLGAVAARTAEERKALEGTPSVSRSNEDLPDDSRLEELLQDFVLTREGFFRYVDARALIMDVRLRVGRVDVVLLSAENRGAGPLTMQKVMTEDRDLKAMMASAGIAPGAYTLNEVAYRRALEDAALPLGERGRLTRTRSANVGFAQSIDVRDRIATRWGQLERHLALQHQARR